VVSNPARSTLEFKLNKIQNFDVNLIKITFCDPLQNELSFDILFKRHNKKHVY